MNIHDVERWMQDRRDLDMELPSSRLFYFENLEVYLRTGVRLNPEHGHRERALTLARIDVHGRHQGKGVFRQLMQSLETMAQQYEYDAFYVDQVNSPALQVVLPRYGFIRIAGTDPHEFIYRKEVWIHRNADQKFDGKPAATEPEEMLYMIREDRVMQYVAVVEANGMPTMTRYGKRAMHFRDELIATEQCRILQRVAGLRYKFSVIVSQTTGVQ